MTGITPEKPVYLKAAPFIHKMLPNECKADININ